MRLLRLKQLLILLLVMQSHLSLSQSYPTQRIENGDTVVVMTKQQADQINEVFRQNSISIQQLKKDVEAKTNQVDSVVTDHQVYVKEVYETTEKIMKRTITYDRKMRAQTLVIYGFLSVYMYLLILG